MQGSRRRPRCRRDTRLRVAFGLDLRVRSYLPARYASARLRLDVDATLRVAGYHWRLIMARSRSRSSLGHRAEQTGLLLATTNGPLTFQRTLMPRATADQALITGLSFASNHALAS